MGSPRYGAGAGRQLAELESEAGHRPGAHAPAGDQPPLTEAIGLYRAAGYREVAAFNDEPYAHHWFENPLEA